MTESEWVDNAIRFLGDIVSRYDFVVSTEETHGSMGEGHAVLENAEFWITIERDRGGSPEWIIVGPKARPRPGAHMRSWSLSHIRGFLDGLDDHYRFQNLEDQCAWFEENHEQVLDVDLLNSDSLQRWAVQASKRLFGKKKPS